MDDLNLISSEVKGKLFELYKDKLKEIILYGSYARGEEREDSDIDLAIIIKGNIRPFKEIDRIIDQIYDIELKYNLLFSIHPISEGNYKLQNIPFLINVKEEGILI